jgi:hypothetical protein
LRHGNDCSNLDVTSCPALGSPFLAPTVTERTMGRIALLWLVLTPLWIAFSFSASTSKVAFIPPALVVIALLFYWLHNKFVVLVAGEHEPRHERADVRVSQSSHFDRAAAASLVRPAFVALGVGACVGAAVTTSFFLFDRPFHESTDTSTAALAPQPNSAISVQPKAVKSLSFAAEQKTENNSLSSDNPIAKQAEAQNETLGQSSTDQPHCNVSLCENYYQSFRASDCTYQPYSGPRQYCAR